MTEQEWLRCKYPIDMLNFVRDKTSDRKLRLFACASCVHDPDWGRDIPLKSAVAAMEQLADGLLGELDRPRYNTFTHRGLICCLGSLAGVAAALGTMAHLPEGAPLAPLCRDIFGNPFRPVVLDPAWRTSTVVALAEGIYAERAFDRMPILADALQDAGCNNDDILNHCRDTSVPHVRGCWVVDLILGKS